VGWALPSLPLLLCALLAGACSGPETPVADGPAPSATEQGGFPPACSSRPPLPSRIEDLPLTVGTGPEIPLLGGEAHAYRLVAPAGTFLELVVLQQGIDVVIYLSDAADASHCKARVDSPNGTEGPEPLPILFATGDSFLLLVHAPDPSAAGSYRIDIPARRPGRREDRARVDAERLFADGEGERRRGTPEARQRAVELDARALELFTALGDEVRQADVHYARAKVLDSLNRYGEATEHYARALDLFRQQERPRAMVRTSNSLGRLYGLQGRQRRAQAVYEKALPLVRGPAETIGLRLNLGRLYLDQRKLEEARQQFDLALEEATAAGDSQAQGKIWHNRALLDEASGRGQDAVRSFQEALALLGEDDRWQRAVTEASLASTLADLDRLGQALPLFAEAIAALRQLGDQRELAVAQSNYCRALRHQEDLARTLGCAADAVRIFTELGEVPSLAKAWNNLGWVQLRRGQAEAAQVSHHHALELALELARAGQESGGSEATAHLGLARVARAEGDLSRAREEIEIASRLIEELRRRPASPSLRASLFATLGEVHELYMALLMELEAREPGRGYGEEALTVSESARARALLDQLAEAGLDLYRGAAPELLVELEDVEAEIRTLAGRQHSGDEGSAAEPGLDRRLLDLGTRRRSLETRIRVASPLWNALEPTVPLSAPEIRRVVGRDGLLLEIALGEERSFLWAVSAEVIHSFVLPPRRELEGAARETWKRLTLSEHPGARAAAERALGELSALILAPVLAELRGRETVVIVADGALGYIPFGALPLPGPAGGADGQPSRLADLAEVISAPSASALDVLRRRRRSVAPRRTLAVIADPVFSPDDPRLGGRTATSHPPLSLPGGRTLERLAWTRQEARILLDLVGPDQSSAALGFAASRDAVFSQTLAEARIVHLATHGFLDAEHPELSGIALSQFDADGRPRNGFLLTHELYSLRLAADLVVLSACETALGEEIRGEGLTGLARGFLHAGARQVLVSLWAVEDEATARLMELFYRAMLEDGLAPPAALGAAQRALRSEPRWASPYYWAGFVIQGAL